jgi:hypothetical protein
VSCHAGSAFTNNRVIDVDEVKTQPSRAKAFKGGVKLMEEAMIYSFDTPVPIPPDAKVLKVPTEHVDEEQRKLTLAQDENESGGYKVKGLIGLAWTPPYLHDGGVTVGPDAKKDLGLLGTFDKGVNPDPFNSLKALVDKKLRGKVIEANRKSKGLQKVNIAGTGHEYWVDESTGYTQEEQDALVEYILSLKSSEGR